MTTFELPGELAWAIVVLGAWALGELLRGTWRLPRICTYAVVGFLCGPAQSGLLPNISSGNVLLLANIAFGLILFEAGHRLNLRWLNHNRWLAAASVIEAASTFVAVYLLARQFELPITSASLLAALSMASSPATVLRVVNELRSSGQVTERVIHLSVLNCLMAVFIFKLLLGYRIFETSGSLANAAYSSLMVLLFSAAVGVAFGIVLPSLLRMLGRTRNDSTLAFAMSVILLVALTHYLQQSPVLATLAFGIAARHRRIVLSRAESGFGTLGDVLSVLLFVSVASSIHWNLATSGWLLGVSLLLVRSAAKIISLWCFARPSGVTFRKGALTGIAMSPFSVFVILVLEQTRYLGINLIDQLAPLAMAALVLELAGPLLTQLALYWAHEVPESEVN